MVASAKSKRHPVLALKKHGRGENEQNGGIYETNDSQRVCIR
jgi:hypothetical protein